MDGVREFPVGLDGPAYVGAVAAGDHVVSLDAPHNCQVENSPQSVSVTTGGLVRDTVEARFAVTCGTESWNVQITAPTTGVVPPSTRYRVIHETFGYWDYGGPVEELGFLGPERHPRRPRRHRRVLGEPLAQVLSGRCSFDLQRERPPPLPTTRVHHPGGRARRRVRGHMLDLEAEGVSPSGGEGGRRTRERDFTTAPL